jgi:signal transduction histidine kinase
MNDSPDQLLNMLENERRYVARELHDGVAQTTLQLGLQAGICKKLLERGHLEMLGRELAQLEERIQVASRQIRDMINDLRPPLVDPNAGLNEHLIYAIETHLQRGGPPVDYQAGENGLALALTAPQLLSLARVAQEALLNIRKHAGAENVRLVVSTQAGAFYLTIADDGKGFDPAQVETLSTDKGGAGLANLRARVEAIGGKLTITRTPAGWTEITASFPK